MRNAHALQRENEYCVMLTFLASVSCSARAIGCHLPPVTSLLLQYQTSTMSSPSSAAADAPATAAAADWRSTHTIPDAAIDAAYLAGAARAVAAKLATNGGGPRGTGTVSICLMNTTARRCFRQNSDIPALVSCDSRGNCVKNKHSDSIKK